VLEIASVAGESEGRLPGQRRRIAGVAAERRLVGLGGLGNEGWIAGLAGALIVGVAKGRVAVGVALSRGFEFGDELFGRGERCPGSNGGSHSLLLGGDRSVENRERRKHSGEDEERRRDPTQALSRNAQCRPRAAVAVLAVVFAMRHVCHVELHLPDLQSGLLRRRRDHFASAAGGATRETDREGRRRSSAPRWPIVRY